MFCTTCKSHFPLTPKVYADQQCPSCRREHGRSTNLVVEREDPGSQGRRQFLGDIRLPELQQRMREVTKVQLLDPALEYKVTY